MVERRQLVGGDEAVCGSEVVRAQRFEGLLKAILFVAIKKSENAKAAVLN